MNEREIFFAALEITDADKRREYVAAACRDDETLRSQMDRLLNSHSSSGEFLGKTVPEQTPGAGETTIETAAEKFSFLEPPKREGSLGRLGHYEVLELVGRGGFGIVFKAFDEQLHRVVALKALSPELAGSPVARQRFIREARAAAAVAHEHVVTTHAVEDQTSPPYLVMQFIGGISLADKIAISGQLNTLAIMRIGMQLASGLAAAHHQGLVHRDIKPANILLENGVERVKITDFGLARVCDDTNLTQSGVIAGTPQYMSPEQAQAEPIDHRSDLFSLGSVMYAMCTGRPPFSANSAIGILKRVCEAEPPPIRELNPEIPDWLVAIVGRLMEKQPAKRYSSAREVADLLAARLAGLQSPANGATTLRISEPVSSPVPIRGTSRRPALGTALAVAAGLAVAALAGVTVTEMLGITGLFKAKLPVGVADPGDAPVEHQPAKLAAPSSNGLQFDAQNGRIEISLQLQRSALSPLTFEIDFTPGEVPADGKVYRLWNHSRSADLSIQGDRLILEAGDKPGRRESAVRTTAIHPGRRLNVAATVSPQALQLFVDGRDAGVHREAVAKTSTVLRPITLGQPLDLEWALAFDGVVHRFRITEGIRYTGDYQPAGEWEPDASTLVLYDFHDDPGQQVQDLSGKGHHGHVFSAKRVRAGKQTSPTKALDNELAAERQAAQWVQSAGGSVELTSPGGHVIQPAGGKLPDEPFSLTGVYFYTRPDVRDADLAHLKGCRRLKMLLLYGTSVTGSGLTHLDHIDTLEHLDLSSGAITNDGLAAIAPLAQLKSLNLTKNSGLTDAGLVHLSRLEKLETLWLDDMRLSDDGLAHLSALRNLREVHLCGGGPGLTDAAVSQIIQQSAKLELLAIANGESRRTLAPLPAAKQVRTLFVSGDQLTAEGCKILKGCAELRTLDIRTPLAGDDLLRAAELSQLRKVVLHFWHPGSPSPGDAAYSALARLPQLEEIQIEGSQPSPSDAVLADWSKIPNLKTIGLGHDEANRRYTPEGIARFCKLRPDVKLDIDGKVYSGSN